MAETEESNMDDLPRDDIIKANILAYLPHIRTAIQPTDLLKLKCYRKEQRKKIFELSRKSGDKAVELGLQMLIYDIEDSGRFIAFKELMASENGYPKIARYIDCEIVASDEHFRKLLELFADQIVPVVNPTEILPTLLARELITNEDVQRIRAEMYNHGRDAAAWEMLFRLQSRKENWFKEFLVSLIDHGYNDVAEKLEPDMFNKIVVQKNEDTQMNDNSKDSTVSMNSETEEPNAFVTEGCEIGSGEDKQTNTDMEMSNLNPESIASSHCKPNELGSNTLKMELDGLGMEFMDMLLPQNKEAVVTPSANDDTTSLKAVQARTSRSVSQTDDAITADKSETDQFQLKESITQYPDHEKLTHLNMETEETLVKVIARDDITSGLSRQESHENQTQLRIHDDSSKNHVSLSDFSNDEIIRGNLKSFSGYICLCLEPTDFLRLHYFNQEQRKRLRDCELSMAVKMGYNIFMNEIDDPGRFVAFYELMASENGYPKIAQILKGEFVACDEPYRRLLDLFVDDLLEKIPNPTTLIPILEGFKAINDADAQEIRAEYVNKGHNRAIWVLLFKLPCRVETWFKDFMNALIECDLLALAEKLEPDIFKKLMAQHTYDERDSCGTEIEIATSFDSEEAKSCGNEDVPDFSELLQSSPVISDEEETCLKANSAVDDLTSDFNELLNNTDSHETEIYSRLPKDEARTTVKQTRSQMDATEAGKRLVYDKEFLLACKGSPFSTICPPEIANIPDIDIRMTTRIGIHDTEDNEENKIRNDLNIIGPERVISEEEFEINIETDQDDLGTNVDDVDISLRGYQKELAQEGCDGENVIVMAPTNSGKTRVACRIMQVHLRRKIAERKKGRILFLVENEALAIQQGVVCAERLPTYRTKVFSGNVHRLKKQMLWDFLERRDIFVVTAQILVNALKAKKIESVREFSLIVFDECHHSNKQHMYNEIMARYLHLKLREGVESSKMPQIVGLTASLGVGGKTEWGQGVEHMKKIMANMDAKFLCTVRKPDTIQELKLYVNPPVEELLPVPGRAVDWFKNAVEDIAKRIDTHMATHQTVRDAAPEDTFIKTACRFPPTFGTEKYLQWNAEFVKQIAKVRSKDIRRVINPCRLHLEVYNKALMVHSDARIRDALVILEEFMEDFRVVPAEHRTDAFLMALYDELLAETFDTEPENPKLLKLEQILSKVLCEDQNGRGIIFVRTRELAQALVRWVNETDGLNILNASEFVGQSASASVGGMTKSGQKDVLQYFKDGQHRLLIATSVAEEGLDISKCNLVIRYEHVTNEIVRLQSRGRARAENSLYYVIAEEDSWILAKEEKNRQCEELMNQIVPHLQVFIEDHANTWERELLEIQERMKQEEEKQAEEREINTAATGARFECFNCSSFICLSDDIRVIKDAHHVIIDEDAKRRLILRRGAPTFTEPEGAEYGGALYCANEECQRELGSVCTYKFSEFPLVGLKNFRIVDRFGQGRAFKKWKKVNCRIEEFTFEDLEAVVAEGLANL
ncbi:antiviral innate immune response receptor RIG-I-like isoform X1 [Mya arenaria]|uniref:antiviral innate immune response receptor RIG-I-like isoform X1 n=1 Tax=Mya arenaria TaxID=6604 RepID=UPI0022E21FED|nr:antiviral innate immune response receptor RIG-I-like isoform X1 [Mya arenaria]